ncbi:hypothetical protein Q7P37_009957 [Cladosporium fusiforme]
MADDKISCFSSDDGMTSDTDVERFIISEDRSMAEYYLGKKYFEFTMAAWLLKRPDVAETWSELDVCEHHIVFRHLANVPQSKLEKMKREFPCREILLAIHEQAPRRMWRQGWDDYEELMMTFGAIVREGDETIRTFADELLKQKDSCGTKVHCIGKERPMMSPEIHQSPSPTPSGKNIAFLQQYGDQIGEMPRYEEKSVIDYPPLFESILCFSGKVFKGKGKSKKKARQMAAQRACGEFGIAIDH